MTQRQETLIGTKPGHTLTLTVNTPGAQEAKGDIQQLSPTPENST